MREDHSVNEHLELQRSCVARSLAMAGALAALIVGPCVPEVSAQDSP